MVMSLECFIKVILMEKFLVKSISLMNVLIFNFMVSTTNSDSLLLNQEKMKFLL
ncbi:hypothetical protein GLOIN_2v1720396, partial [Rhizophagus irregularis DAOM 181602=DAOM 197198]